MKRYIIAALVAAAAGLLIGCAAKSTLTENTGEYNGYKQITQEEAKDMMAQDDGHIIVDVRRQDEFAAGHIPDAVCIPNETIDKMKPAELPDTEQIILIYCRSGNRSKQAAQKLADMGYTNIYEFGGIIDWTGEVVTEDNVSSTTDETPITISESSENDSEFADITTDPYPVLAFDVGDRTFLAKLEDNSSVDDLISKLPVSGIEITMSDYGGFEKVGDLPFELTTNDTDITTVPGDVILYQGNKITVYYGENTWNFTKLGHIDASREELLEAFGDGETEVRISVEMTE
ncbi:cyclophilin-like fold protein [Ruminococcus sp.]|uniref:cyclophilin-like fold protein n=1 Tax=Ruminococcus sp. TaxID=41978 RepID=UPI001B23F6B0|nr:cyclophilin-like fold protein [Ruminococcus sp.]MBO5559642.1 hypothetical protein [Ruminococcus sp.]